MLRTQRAFPKLWSLLIIALEKQPIQTTATFNGIDQPYFNIVQDHGDKLFLFIQKLNDDPRLKEEVDNAVHFHSTGKPAEIPFPDLINML